MSKPPPDPDRRRLLRRTGHTAAAGAALAVLGPSGATAESAVAPAGSRTPAAQARGYQETEHTRRYYALARF